MTFALSFISVLALAWLSYRTWKKQSVLRQIFWPALTVKLVAAIGVGVLYTYYYPSGDTFLFFRDGYTLMGWGKENFITYCEFLWNSDDSSEIWKSIHAHQPRTLFFSKIVSLVNFATGGNYWITAAYLSFVSFLCSITFGKTLIRYFPASEWAAVVACLFIPSVVFWGSGIVKECLVMASLFFLSSIFLRIMKDDRINLKDWLLAALFSWILWNIKYYYAAVFFVVAITTVITKFGTALFRIRQFRWQMLFWFTVFFLPLYLVSLSIENFYPENFFYVVVQNYEVYKALSANGGAIEYDALEPNGLSLLLNSPWALFSALFRPWLWEVQNIFQFLASLENMTLLIFMLSSLWQLKKRLAQSDSTDCMLILATVSYVILLGVFLALSTPNFGTLSRYRVGFLPFLFFLVLYRNTMITQLATFIQRSFSRLVR